MVGGVPDGDNTSGGDAGQPADADRQDAHRRDGSGRRAHGDRDRRERQPRRERATHLDLDRRRRRTGRRTVDARARDGRRQRRVTWPGHRDGDRAPRVAVGEHDDHLARSDPAVDRCAAPGDQHAW